MSQEEARPKPDHGSGDKSVVGEEGTGTVEAGTETNVAQAAGPDVAVAESASSVTQVAVPEFAPLTDSSNGPANASVQRLRDVNVTVAAELGRVTLPIGRLLELGEGSVVELSRPVSAPVDLRADGVLLARGEVVVVDDCFAVRIRSIESE